MKTKAELNFESSMLLTPCENEPEQIFSKENFTFWNNISTNGSIIDRGKKLQALFLKCSPQFFYFVTANETEKCLFFGERVYSLIQNEAHSPRLLCRLAICI